MPPPGRCACDANGVASPGRPVQNSSAAKEWWRGCATASPSTLLGTPTSNATRHAAAFQARTRRKPLTRTCTLAPCLLYRITQSFKALRKSSGTHAGRGDVHTRACRAGQGRPAPETAGRCMMGIELGGPTAVHHLESLATGRGRTSAALQRLKMAQPKQFWRHSRNCGGTHTHTHILDTHKTQRTAHTHTQADAQKNSHTQHRQGQQSMRQARPAQPFKAFQIWTGYGRAPSSRGSVARRDNRV